MNNFIQQEVGMLSEQEILSLRKDEEVEYRDRESGFFYYGHVTKAADLMKKEIGLKLLDYKKQPYKNDIFKISNLLLYPANSILGQLNVRVDKHFVLEGDEIRFHEPGAANTQCKTAQVTRLYPNGFIQLQFKDGRKYWSHQFLKGELENNICGINSSNNCKQYQQYMKHNSYVQEEKQQQQQEQRQMNIKQEQTVSVQLLIDATDGELQMLTQYGDALAELVTTRTSTGINNMKDDYNHDEQDIDMNTSSIQQRQQQQQKQKPKQKQNGRGKKRRPKSVKIQGKDDEADDEKSEKDKDKENNNKKNGLCIDPKIERKVEICNIKAITGLTIFGGQMESFLELSKEREEDPSVGIKNSQQMMNRFLKDTKLRLKQRGCNDQVIEYVFDRLLPFIKGMKSAANGNELPSFKVLKRQKFDEQGANVVLTNVFKALNHTVPDKINNIRNNYQDIAMTQKMNVLQMDDDDNNNNNNNNNGSIDFNEDDANSLYRDIHKELKHVKSAQQALIDAQKSTEEDQRKRMAKEPNCFN